MTIIHTLLFSLVEGITEFLPISSTGHLILTAKLLGIEQTVTQESFEIAIQLGAILAVVVLYGRTLLRDRRTLVLVGIAFLPTAVIGFLLHTVVKEFLLGSIPTVLAALFVGGIVLIVFERFVPKTAQRNAVTSISPRQAVLVGIFQSLAIIPGVSRSAATIVGGELIGIPKQTIVEFSFLLAIPTMAAATGYDLLKTAGQFTAADVQALVIGFVLSFMVALAAIKWFLAYVKNHSFVVFGVYRVIVAVAFFLFWK